MNQKEYAELWMRRCAEAELLLSVRRKLADWVPVRDV